MATPEMGDRKYTDEQRAAMFDLHKAGYKPTEIARLCAQGTASCKPFEIPRRTVHDIVCKMAFERDYKPPTRFEDIDGADTLEEFPSRTLRILNQELGRIERKTKRTDRDINRLTKLNKLRNEIRNAYRAPGPTPQTNGNGSKETSIERLAREMR